MTLRSVSSSVPPGRNAPYILAQSAVPVCLAPNGTVATNGIVTLGTALPATYSGGIWLRFPADAIVGGAAGLYWAVMTSTTQGQVYTNFADPASPFLPFIPSGTLVAAAGSNAAYTQTTGADITLVNVTLPGGSMGTNGALRVQKEWSSNNNANTKLGGSKLAGTAIHQESVISCTVYPVLFSCRNRGVANRQIGSRTNANLASTVNTGDWFRTSVDTSVACALTDYGNLATATDFLVLESFEIEVRPS